MRNVVRSGRDQKECLLGEKDDEVALFCSGLDWTGLDGTGRDGTRREGFGGDRL